MLNATLELIEVDGRPEASIAFLNITLIVDLTTMGFWIASSLTSCWPVCSGEFRMRLPSPRVPMLGVSLQTWSLYSKTRLGLSLILKNPLLVLGWDFNGTRLLVYFRHAQFGWPWSTICLTALWQRSVKSFLALRASFRHSAIRLRISCGEFMPSDLVN